MSELLYQWIERGRQDPRFLALNASLADGNVQHWLSETEKALLFGLAAFAPGGGITVEIGAFQGGSAAFLAGGLSVRGHGKLFSIDPHLGGPPWLGMAPSQSTLEIFRSTMRTCHLEKWVSAKVGESSAVAAVWPGLEIDLLLIDGDHSFLGALKDLESWLPKTKSGGYLLVDDADDPFLVELADFVEFAKSLKSIDYIGMVEGTAVFRRSSLEPWDSLSEIGKRSEQRGLFRPWAYASFHSRSLPASYLRSRTWANEPGLDVAYQLGYLARCGPGLYGYTNTSDDLERSFLRALSQDRGDGDCVEVGESGSTSGFRVILCSLDEAEDVAGALHCGGLMICKDIGSRSLQNRGRLIDAGLEGCGFGHGLLWGIWRPSFLSSEAIVSYASDAFNRP